MNKNVLEAYRRILYEFDGYSEYEADWIPNLDNDVQSMGCRVIDSDAMRREFGISELEWKTALEKASGEFTEEDVEFISNEFSE